MVEEPSCRSSYHEEYIQTSASGNPEGLCRSSILNHYDHLMMDTFKNRSRKFKSFFLYLLTAEFHHTE